MSVHSGFPILEISDSYNADCLNTIFNMAPKYFSELHKNIYPAILSRDLSIIDKTFYSILSGITFYVHISKEKYYHSLIYVTFMAMDFEVYSEIASTIGQYVIIKIKYADAVPNKPDLNMVENFLKNI